MKDTLFKAVKLYELIKFDTLNMF